MAALTLTAAQLRREKKKKNKKNHDENKDDSPAATAAGSDATSTPTGAGADASSSPPDVGAMPDQFQTTGQLQKGGDGDDSNGTSGGNTVEQERRQLMEERTRQMEAEGHGRLWLAVQMAFDRGFEDGVASERAMSKQREEALAAERRAEDMELLANLDACAADAAAVEATGGWVDDDRG